MNRQVKRKKSRLSEDVRHIIDAEVEDLKNEYTHEVFELVLYTALYVLHNEFKFGQKRLTDMVQATSKHWEWIGGDPERVKTTKEFVEGKLGTFIRVREEGGLL